MTYLRYSLIVLGALLCCACKPAPNPTSKGQTAPAANAATTTLAAARQGFKTHIVTTVERKFPAPSPPAEVLSLVRYRSPAGELPAHLSPDPGDGVRHPAIIWIAGGDCNSIGENWIEGPPENEQSATAYRKAGIIMMFPSLRGGNNNPGQREGFFGEVDDVLAAADYVSQLSYVDPQRIYLGGHSTGGTLSMLVAELSNRFRAVFALGPVSDIRNYGDNDFIFHDPNDTREAELRAPGRWLDSVRGSLFVFEGTDGNSNIDDLKEMRARNRNPSINFFAVDGMDHFEVLAPLNRLIAAKIMSDSGALTEIAFTAAELQVAR